MIYHGKDGDGQLTDLAFYVRQAATELQPFRDRFDSIAVQGTSGVVVGSPVSLRLRKPLIIVRKPKEITGGFCHSVTRVINIAHIGKRYLILDDFMSRGRTLERIRQTITLAVTAPEWFERCAAGLGYTPECAGHYLYITGGMEWADAA